MISGSYPPNTLAYTMYGIDRYSFESCKNACQEGDLKRVQQWLLEDNFRLHPDLFLAAVVGKQLETLQWLYSQNPFFMDCLHEGRTLKDVAISLDATEIVEWLTKTHTCDNFKTCVNACYIGDLELVKNCVLEGNNILYFDLFTAAVVGNQLKIVEWLIDQKFRLKSCGKD